MFCLSGKYTPFSFFLLGALVATNTSDCADRTNHLHLQGYRPTARYLEDPESIILALKQTA
jgi:hypothetical protein